jgi:hypothetical protein
MAESKTIPRFDAEVDIAMRGAFASMYAWLLLGGGNTYSRKFTNVAAQLITNDISILAKWPRGTDPASIGLASTNAILDKSLKYSLKVLRMVQGLRNVKEVQEQRKLLIDEVKAPTDGRIFPNSLATWLKENEADLKTDRPNYGDMQRIFSYTPEEQARFKLEEDGEDEEKRARKLLDAYNDALGQVIQVLQRSPSAIPPFDTRWDDQPSPSAPPISPITPSESGNTALKDCESHIQSLGVEKDNLEARVANLIDNARTEQETLQKATAAAHINAEKLSQVQGQLASEKEGNESLNRKIGECETGLEECGAELAKCQESEAKYKTLENEKRKLEQQVKVLEQQNEDLFRTIRINNVEESLKLRAIIDDRNVRITALEAQVINDQERQKLLDDRNDRIKALEAQIGVLQASVSELQLKQVPLRENDCQNQLAKASSDISSLNTENTRLQHELDQTNKATSELKSQLDGYNNMIRITSEELTKATQAYDRQTDEIKKCQQLKTDLEESLARMQSGAKVDDELKRQLEVINTENQYLRKKDENLLRENVVLKQELERIKSQSTGTPISHPEDTTIRDLKERIDILTVERDSALNRIKELSDQQQHARGRYNMPSTSPAAFIEPVDNEVGRLLKPTIMPYIDRCMAGDDKNNLSECDLRTVLVPYLPVTIADKYKVYRALDKKVQLTLQLAKALSLYSSGALLLVSYVPELLDRHFRPIFDKSGKVFADPIVYNELKLLRVNYTRAKNEQTDFRILSSWMNETNYDAVELGLQNKKVQKAIEDLCNNEAEVFPISNVLINPQYIWAHVNRGIYVPLHFQHKADGCYNAPVLIKVKKHVEENIAKGSQMLLRSLQHMYNAIDLYRGGVRMSSGKHNDILQLLSDVLPARKKKFTEADLFKSAPSDLAGALFFEAMYSYWYDVIASKKECKHFIYAKEEDK